MVDNNRDPMYCCALVYDMPHRIKYNEKEDHKNQNSIWRFIHADHPSKLVCSELKQSRNSGQMALSKSAIDLLANTTNDEYVYLPHACVVMSKEKPHFDLLVPALQVYFSHMLVPGLCGITNNQIFISDMLSQLDSVLKDNMSCLSVPNER